MVEAMLGAPAASTRWRLSLGEIWADGSTGVTPWARGARAAGCRRRAWCGEPGEMVGDHAGGQEPPGPAPCPAETAYPGLSLNALAAPRTRSPVGCPPACFGFDLLLLESLSSLERRRVSGIPSVLGNC